MATRARARDGAVARKFGKMFYEFSLCSIGFIWSTEHALLRLCLNSSLNQIWNCYSEKLTVSGHFFTFFKRHFNLCNFGGGARAGRVFVVVNFTSEQNKTLPLPWSRVESWTSNISGFSSCCTWALRWISAFNPLLLASNRDNFSNCRAGQLPELRGQQEVSPRSHTLHVSTLLLVSDKVVNEKLLLHRLSI
jgi:hypothetical protein